MNPSLDVMDEDVTAPALRYRGLAIAKPHLSGIELVQLGNVVAPGQLCNGGLHDYEVWPCRGEGPPPWHRRGRAQARLAEPIYRVRLATWPRESCARAMFCRVLG